MAATEWFAFRGFKDALGRGNIDLSGTNTSFRMVLMKSAALLSATSGTIISSITNTVNTGAHNFRALTVNFSAATTTSVLTWTWNTVIWTVASDSAMTSVKYAVIYAQTASTLICWSRLSTAEFQVAAGNTYVIEPNPVCFEMRG